VGVFGLFPCGMRAARLRSLCLSKVVRSHTCAPRGRMYRTRVRTRVCQYLLEGCVPWLGHSFMPIRLALKHASRVSGERLRVCTQLVFACSNNIHVAHRSRIRIAWIRDRNKNFTDSNKKCIDLCATCRIRLSFSWLHTPREQYLHTVQTPTFPPPNLLYACDF
jgi:hypothetical protein